jgi:hypothetical protein
VPVWESRGRLRSGDLCARRFLKRLERRESCSIHHAQLGATARSWTRRVAVLLLYFVAVLPVPECPTQSLADGLREGSS